jgi:hypothetical protein
MGQLFTYALDVVEKEFARVQCTTPGANAEPEVDPSKLARNIRYDQLKQFNLPESIHVEVDHIAVLFVLDANHDGLFSCEDLTEFVKWLATEMPHDVPVDEFCETARAKCVLEFWRRCRAKGVEMANRPTRRGTLPPLPAGPSGSPAKTPVRDAQVESPPSPFPSTTAADPSDYSLQLAEGFFSDWLLLLLLKNFEDFCFANPADMRVSPAPLCPPPSRTVITVEAEDQLPGAVQVDDSTDVSRSSSPRHTEDGSRDLDVSRKSDGSGFFSPVSSNENLLEIVNPGSHLRPTPLNSSPPPRPAVHPESMLVGLTPMFFVYTILNVSDGYGLSFTNFCHILNPRNLRPHPEPAHHRSLNSSSSEAQLNAYHSFPPPIGASTSLSAVAGHWRAEIAKAQANLRGTTSDEQQEFAVPSHALKTCLMSFVGSYWRILSRLGLEMLL